MANNETHGKVTKVTGQVKEAAGVLIGNKELEEAGAEQRAEGALEENLAKAKRKVGELVDAVAKTIKE
jgi:uncharacterized protein YjbJ (UPF0337 family)